MFLACVHRADQPFVADLDQAEPPLPLVDSGLPAPDARHITRPAFACRLGSSVGGEVDLASVERDILLLQSLEGPRQVSLVDRRPDLDRSASVQRTERSPIASQRVFDPAGVGFDR